jgi:hypothetical protein
MASEETNYIVIETNKDPLVIANLVITALIFLVVLLKIWGKGYILKKINENLAEGNAA